MDELIVKSSFSFQPCCVKETYYNPDSSSGGQLVINRYSKEHIIIAYQTAKTDEEFWDYLDSVADQVLIDRDDDDFDSMIENLKCLRERNEATMKSLHCWAISEF